MNSFGKGLVVGGLVVIGVVMILAAAEAPSSESGRYQGLDREGPMIVVDTQTGDFIIQGPNGKPQGHRWADAWKSD